MPHIYEMRSIVVIVCTRDFQIATNGCIDSIIQSNIRCREASCVMETVVDRVCMIKANGCTIPSVPR